MRRCTSSRRAGLAVLAMLMAAVPMSAGFATEMEDVLVERASSLLPSDWQVRVSRRDRALVMFVTPPTTQAFSLLYDANSSVELVRKLCPDRDSEVWRKIDPAEDIAVQPTVLGKTGLRTSCRATLAETPR